MRERRREKNNRKSEPGEGGVGMEILELKVLCTPFWPTRCNAERSKTKVAMRCPGKEYRGPHTDGVG